MTNKGWLKEIAPGPPASTPKPSTTKAHGRPAWSQVAVLGIVVFLFGWGLAKWGAKQHSLRQFAAVVDPWTVKIAVGFWIGAAILLVFWLPRRLSAGRRGGENLEDADAERNAVADEFKIPPKSVRVAVRVGLYWKWPLWRVTKVRVWLPRGKVAQDPSKRLALRLEPLVGTQLRKKAWKPRKGLLVLVPGAPDPTEEADIPSAETDPQKRAVQVLGGILRTDQLHTDPHERDEEGNVTAFAIRHPTNVRVAGTDVEHIIGARLDAMMPPAAGGRGWSVTVNARQDYVLVKARTPLPDRVLHPVIDYQAEFGDRIVLPFATGEGDRIVGWDITPGGQTPHALIVGPTGGGKTSTIRTLVVGATRQQIPVSGLDPKMVELMGMEGWPGVGRVAFTIADMAELITDDYEDMLDIYTRVKRREIHPSELTPSLFILDEYLVLRAMLLLWWKEELAQRGNPPQIGQLQSGAALSRTAKKHRVVGIQRPDATFFDSGARDNYRQRMSLSQLSPQGAEMMWNDRSVGVKPTGRAGRGWTNGPDGYPLEAQYWWTPDMDSDPMYRQYLSPEEATRIDALRPEPFIATETTDSGLHVPKGTASASKDIPEGSVQRDMQDVTDAMYARELREGYLIKLMKGDRLEAATVDEDPEYDEGDPVVDLYITWEQGGSSEVVTLPDNETVLVLSGV